MMPPAIPMLTVILSKNGMPVVVVPIAFLIFLFTFT
jgi:hypothetical protein